MNTKDKIILTNKYNKEETINKKDKYNKYNKYNKYGHYILNLLLAYFSMILLLTVIHINTVPLSKDVVSLAIAENYEPLNISARKYLIENNMTRIKATLYLCLLGTKAMHVSIFDRTDHLACDYYKTGKGIREWLKLDRDR
jgi:hypothetical protein